MGTKKRRQRGSSSHGGGSRKNRRGAGHRGGRGRAGRSKHEFHNYSQLGKSGFKRPEKVQRERAEINVSKLDEDIPILESKGLIERLDGKYWVDIRNVVEDGWEVDDVRLLGSGQVRNEWRIVTDTWTEDARKLVEDQGGELVRSARGISIHADDDLIVDVRENKDMVDNYLTQKRRVVEEGGVLTYDEVRQVLDRGDRGEIPEVAHNILRTHFGNITESDEVNPKDVPALYAAKFFAERHNFNHSEIDNILEEYFDKREIHKELRAELREGLPKEITPDELFDIIERKEQRLRKADRETFEDDEGREEAIQQAQKSYLSLVRDRISAEG